MDCKDTLFGGFFFCFFSVLFSLFFFLCSFFSEDVEKAPLYFGGKRPFLLEILWCFMSNVLVFILLR